MKSTVSEPGLTVLNFKTNLNFKPHVKVVNFN